MTSPTTLSAKLLTANLLPNLDRHQNVRSVVQSGRVGRFFCPPFSNGCCVSCSYQKECQFIPRGHEQHVPPYPAGAQVVERFNGRIAEILRNTRYRSANELSVTLGHLILYNGHIPQHALGHVSPLDALKSWREKEPKRFVSEIYNLTGLDSLPSFGTAYGPKWLPNLF
jgi:hypothetical protein